MIQYEGMKAEENVSFGGQLPAGAYVGKTLKVELVGQVPDQALILYLDVAEGECENFWMNKFLSAKAAGSKYGDVKFKGTYRLRIPNKNNKNDQDPSCFIQILASSCRHLKNRLYPCISTLGKPMLRSTALPSAAV